jgi:predicted NUDIX family NTP pyrophosphohydrolase
MPDAPSRSRVSAGILLFRRTDDGIEVPEIDRVAWFTPDVARLAINHAQADLIDELLAFLSR